MPNQQLKDYINQQLTRGASKEQISAFLIQSGWKQSDIDLAFMNAATNITLPPPPPPPSSPSFDKDLKNQNSPTTWDAFEHLILFISLYVVASTAGLMLHFVIDKLFPAAVINSYPYYSGSQLVNLNWYLASLIVATPIFCAVFLDIQRRTSKNPQIKNLPIRKAFIYLTLMITFLFMLFKITLSVYNLLSGNVSLNSFLHLLVNITIPAMIFGYYAFQVRGDREIND